MAVSWPGLRKNSGWGRANRPGKLPGDAVGETPRTAYDKNDPAYPREIGKQLVSPTVRAHKALEASVGRELTPVQKRNRKSLVARQSETNPRHAIHEAIRFVPGGRSTIVNLIQRAARNGHADAEAWWRVYADLEPSDQLRVDLDAVCEGAGVAPDALMGMVVSTAMRMGQDVADLVAATTLPTLVHQTIKSAMRIGGNYAEVAFKDRQSLLQHHKFIPTPRGTNVTVHANAQAASAASQPSVPSFMDSLAHASESTSEVHDALVLSDGDPTE